MVLYSQVYIDNFNGGILTYDLISIFASYDTFTNGRFLSSGGNYLHLGVF